MSRLPGTNTRALWTLALFAAVQGADAVQTALGVQRFGHSIEANPIVSFYVALAGPAVALIGAKAFAVGCAAILYAFERYAVIALLTLAVVFSALIPWAALLAS